MSAATQSGQVELLFLLFPCTFVLLVSTFFTSDSAFPNGRVYVDLHAVSEPAISHKGSPQETWHFEDGVLPSFYCMCTDDLQPQLEKWLTEMKDNRKRGEHTLLYFLNGFVKVGKSATLRRLLPALARRHPIVTQEDVDVFFCYIAVDTLDVKRWREDITCYIADWALELGLLPESAAQMARSSSSHLFNLISIEASKRNFIVVPMYDEVQVCLAVLTSQLRNQILPFVMCVC